MSDNEGSPDEYRSPAPDSSCGHPVNSNGNCFDSSCWNGNSKRHDGIGRD